MRKLLLLMIGAGFLAHSAHAAFYHEKAEPVVEAPKKTTKKKATKKKQTAKKKSSEQTAQTKDGIIVMAGGQKYYLVPAESVQQGAPHNAMVIQPYYPHQALSSNQIMNNGLSKQNQMQIRALDQYQIFPGEKLSQALTRWAQTTGKWQLIYDAPDRIIQTPVKLNTTFEEAIFQVLEVLNDDGEYLIAKFYEGNNVLRIQEAE